MKRNKNDLIAEIKTEQAHARHKAQAYASLPAKLYDFYRAVAATMAYYDALALIDDGKHDHVRALADDALDEWETAQNVDVTELMLAQLDGRRDALLTVVDLMAGGDLA